MMKINTALTAECSAKHMELYVGNQEMNGGSPENWTVTFGRHPAPTNSLCFFIVVFQKDEQNRKKNLRNTSPYRIFLTTIEIKVYDQLDY